MEIFLNTFKSDFFVETSFVFFFKKCLHFYMCSRVSWSSSFLAACISAMYEICDDKWLLKCNVIHISSTFIIFKKQILLLLLETCTEVYTNQIKTFKWRNNFVCFSSLNSRVSMLVKSSVAILLLQITKHVVDTPEIKQLFAFVNFYSDPLPHTIFRADFCFHLSN